MFFVEVEIDFEADPVINITIQVTDRDGLTLRRNFSVRVEDVNESPTKIRLSQKKVGKMTLTERNVWILNLVIFIPISYLFSLHPRYPYLARISLQFALCLFYPLHISVKMFLEYGIQKLKWFCYQMDNFFKGYS